MSTPGLLNYEVSTEPESLNWTESSSTQKSQLSTILQASLHDSRKSILSGAFLTRANVQPGTLQEMGLLDLHFGIHQFLQTRIVRATVLVAVRPSMTVPPQPATAPQTVKVQELVFGFKDNPTTFFLVPRDSTLEEQSSDNHLYTFLTLRNQPGGTVLQHQVIPVTFQVDDTNRSVVGIIRSHINKHDEVKEKMANATRHIPRMPLAFIQYGLLAERQGTKAAKQVIPAQQSSKLASPTPVSSPKAQATKKPRLKKVKASPKLKDVKNQTADAQNKKQKKASIIPAGWSCEICGVNTTVMRRRGPSGLNCACNSCGQAWAQANRARQKSEDIGSKTTE